MNWISEWFHAICITEQNTEAWNDDCGFQDRGQMHKTTIIQRHSNLATELNHSSRFRLKTKPILNIRTDKKEDSNSIVF